MSRYLCPILIVIFAALYVLALGILAIGTFGLFGNDRDPLAGVFLMPLGIPWIWLTAAAPEGLRPWLAAATPGLNLLILMAACRLYHLRQRRAGGS